MKCILMNKNVEILIAEYNETSKFFDKIYEIKNINYAPYILKSFYIEKNINDINFITNLSVFVTIILDNPSFLWFL